MTTPPLLLLDPYDPIAPEWRDTLRLSRWTWPRSPGLEPARLASGRRSPPRLRPGQTLLVTVNEAAAALWGFDVPAAGGIGATFGPEALAAWTCAAAALPRSLPFLWKPVHDAEVGFGRARFLAALPRRGHSARIERLLDGASFGVSFLMALASRVLGMPLRESVAASAALGPDGKVGPVDGLEDKLTAIATLAPRIRTVLVAHEQEAEALHVTARRGLPLAIEGVRTSTGALSHAFSRRLGVVLADAGRDPRSREEITASLFRLAVDGRKALADWCSVEQAAARALKTFPGQTPEQRWRLEFARAVAARHGRNAGRLPALTRPRLRALHAPIRLGIVASYVQQAADTGRPSYQEAVALARRHLTRPREAFLPHVKIMGALGRLYGVAGRFRDALRMQEQAASVLFGAFAFAEASHQLSEWYRLAGALQDRAAFERAEQAFLQVQAMGGFGDNPPYVELARCKARILLGDARGCLDELQRLAEYFRIAHIRGSALRWLVRALEEERRAADAAVRARELAGGGVPPKFAVLVDLDRSVRAADGRAARAALEALGRMDPGPSRQLLRIAPREIAARAAFVARFYPY